MAKSIKKDNRVIKLFVDFDGTITIKDVGENIFRQFGDMKKVNRIVDGINNSEYEGKEGWFRLFDSLNDVTEKQMEEYVLSIEIDQSFKELVEFARENDIEMVILSDGFDFYIDKIMEREGLSDIKYYSNRMFFNEEGKIEVDFPYPDEECIDCANCKRNKVLEHSGEDEISIYIGNGHSDKCPAQFCDFIFAKDSLLRYCEIERITYFPYGSFTDVVVRLKKLISKNRLKKKHQAELKRRRVFMQG